MSAVLVLMGCNWMLEAAKWRLLVSRKEYITYGQAVQAVLSGVALNMITPNQLGDFLGRLIHLRKLDKVRGTLVTVIGHTAQVIMTAAFGLYAFAWFLLQKGVLSVAQANWIYLGLIVVTIITIIAYLNIAALERLPLGQKIRPYLDAFKGYKRSELVQVLSISFLRYVIFVLQNYLFVLIFQVDVSLHEGIACIIAALCAQSFIPGFILIELGMRGASALWFFGVFTSQIAPVLLATYSLWMVNLMLPGLAGLYFILKWRQQQ